jgi:hypothetical protein
MHINNQKKKVIVNHNQTVLRSDSSMLALLPPRQDPSSQTSLSSELLLETAGVAFAFVMSQSFRTGSVCSLLLLM